MPVGYKNQIESRDRAVDRLFGLRDRLFEQLPQSPQRDADKISEALEAVLGEEIQWRFG